jgi:hypothetical protein
LAHVSRVAVVIALLAGCQSRPKIVALCGEQPACAADETCAVDHCVKNTPVDAAVLPDVALPPLPIPDAATCDPARMCAGQCCAAGTECVGTMCLAPCPGPRCGANQTVCCTSGQVCLDKVVCATACQAQETVCGDKLDVCCPAGQACLDGACVSPGSTCTEDLDCLVDDTYCDQTLGKCLPNPRGSMCQLPVTFDKIDLLVEWHWAGVTVNGKLYENILTSPAVGDVSGDGVPDVVVAPYAGSDVNDRVLVALKGRPATADGELLWVLSGADAPTDEMVALANLDADPALEIVYQLAGGGLRIINGDGATPTQIARRTDVAIGGTRVSPAIADMNQDGTPDIVVGCRVLDGRTPGMAATDLFDKGVCESHSQRFSAVAVADLDGDGRPDVTNGDAAYGLDAAGVVKTLFDRTGNQQAFPAVADLNADGKPEIVAIHNGIIEVLDGATGAVRVGVGGTWANGTFAIPGGGLGGAPTVADFDKDGLPEVAAAGLGFYTVYDPDCLPTPPRAGGKCTQGPNAGPFILWATPTQDISSSATGSSVFDFQGDGVNEVIYNDECFLHVYDGATGAEILMGGPRPNSSRTRHEYPVVVDVDLDGNSEIVVPSNHDEIVRDKCPEKWRAAFGVMTDAQLPDWIRNGTAGIWVFGDPRDKWVRTRPIWNQYSYHVTNVSAAGVVPKVEENNWTTGGLNDYRTNVQGARALNAPNLVVKLDSAVQCATSSVVLSATVTNAGARGVPANVLVDFIQTAPGNGQVVGTAVTRRALLPGGSERITVEVQNIPMEVQINWQVRVDGMGAAQPVIECNEGDNTDNATGRCDPVR